MRPQRAASCEMNTRCGVPIDTAAKRPWASSTLPLRSLDWLMMGEDAARPRCVAASKHTVSNAPRMMPAVTVSTLAEVCSGGVLAASVLFNSNDMSTLLCRRSSDRHRNRDVAILRLDLLGARSDIV